MTIKPVLQDPDGRPLCGERGQALCGRGRDAVGQGLRRESRLILGNC